MTETASISLTRRESENRVLDSNGKPLLVIVEGQDIDAMMDAGMEAIGGLGRIIGKNRKVVLKPNTNQRDPFPSITAPETMRAVSRHCHLAGADHIVVGRPIRDAKDPADAAKKVAEEIEAGLQSRG